MHHLYLSCNPHEIFFTMNFYDLTIFMMNISHNDTSFIPYQLFNCHVPFVSWRLFVRVASV